MAKGGNKQNSITAAEHIGPDDTGDNIEAKRVALYSWDGSNWQRLSSTGFSAASAVYNGKKTVTTAGTRVALSTTQAIVSVTIKALSANTGTIYVGNSTVAAANGFALGAGETVSMDLADLSTINIDSSVNGEGVTYIGIA